jgi:hypothetical protein
MYWTCAPTQPNRENYASSELDRRGFEVYAGPSTAEIPPQRPTPWLGISDSKCAGRPARSSR